MPFSLQISALVLPPFSTASINFNFVSKERHFRFVDAITEYGISMVDRNAKYCSETESNLRMLGLVHVD